MFENLTIPANLHPTDPRFGCGPSLVPVEFLESLAKTGMHLMGTSHRKSAVRKLVKEVQDGLLDYFGVKGTHQVVMGNGGATLLFDMIGLGLVEKKSAHYTCGEFSEKWAKTHKSIPWLQTEINKFEYGQGITFKDSPDCDLIAVTLNETSTGVQLNGLPNVASHQLLAVDATSGAGQCPCDVSKVDVFFFSPQKVFASDGGLWIALMTTKAIDRAKKIAADKNRYIPQIMDWLVAIDNAEKAQTNNTPAIATLFFMNEQIKRMGKLGYKKVQELAEQKANLMYGWADSKSYLSAYIKDPTARSWSVATIDVDEKLKVDDLLTILEKQKLVYGIDSYRKLGRNQLRIALFHNVSITDLEKLMKLLSHAFESQL